MPGGTGRIDWSSGRAQSRDAAAADEPFLAVVKAAGVEVINHHGQRACGHERVHPRLLIEKHRSTTADLVGVVATDNALAGRRVVGLADARPQHQVDVAKRIGSKDHEATGLLELPPARVDIGRAFGVVLCGVEVDLEHTRVGTYLDIGLLRSKRDHREMWARLGVCLAAEALAVAAVVARPIGDAIRIDIGLRRVG